MDRTEKKESNKLDRKLIEISKRLEPSDTKEIAARIDMTTQTVNNSLNNKGFVAFKTRQRVLDAAYAILDERAESLKKYK